MNIYIEDMHPIRMTLIVAIVLILAYVIYSIMPGYKKPVEPFSLPGTNTDPPSPKAEHDQLKYPFASSLSSHHTIVPSAGFILAKTRSN